MTLTAVRDLPAGPERLRRVDLWTQLAPVSGLAGLAVIAAVLRLEGIGTWYWIDESLSIGLARHGLYEIPSLLLRDGSPPLWYLLLHGWTGLFGTSVVATHSLSLLFSLATVPVAWFVTRRLFGERTAWFVGALAAVNPFVTYFARETRMYSLVVLLGIVVGGAFIAAFVDGDRRAAWWFAATLTLLLYTHNWGLYTAVACAVALIPITLAAAPTERRELLRRAAIAFGVVGLCYLPWVPALLSQVSNTGAPWSFTPSLRNVVRELAALFRDERILVVLVLGAGVGAAPLVRRWSSRDGLALIVLAVLVAVPIVIGWGLAHVEPSWATRYLAVVVGPLMVVLGVGLARAGGAGVTALVLATILILQPFTRLGGLPLPRDAKSNARDVAATVAPRLAPGDVVLVAQPEAVPLFATELGEGFRYVSPTGPVEDPLLMDWRDAEDRLRAAGDEAVNPIFDSLEVGERILLITPGNASSSTDTAWVKLFRSAGRRTSRSLRADDRFEVVARVPGDDAPYVTFDAVLFERVTDRTL